MGSIASRFSGLLLALFFVSGFVGLVYEVLWFKELRLLFGSTAYAAATTLAVFFLGLSLGSYAWGRFVARAKSALAVYAVLELGIALCAVFYFFIRNAYYALYPSLFPVLGGSFIVALGVKFFLALLLLFPAAFFMGGTFPAMGEFLLRRTAGALGRTGSLLYAVNTGGAALGALAAGFYLPPYFGFATSYYIAIALNVAIAMTAYGMSCHENAKKLVAHAGAATPPEHSLPAVMNFKEMMYVAFFSGILSLALEVVWTRMFAQVLQNDVYSFAIILVVFLISLGIGGIVAYRLSRSAANPRKILCFLLAGASLTVYLSPFIFNSLTRELQFVAPHGAWGSYIFSLFAMAAAVILPPGILLGSVFPYLMKIGESIRRSPGEAIGRLVQVNTLGSIVGSLAAGFIMLRYVGLWGSIQWTALIYGLLALFSARTFFKKNIVFVSAAVMVAAFLLIPFQFPAVKINSERSEALEEVFQGSDAIVSVLSTPYPIPSGKSFKMAINNSYTLGGTAASHDEARQAHLPLLLHPNPQSVFFLGLGTGASAGTALYHPIRTIVTAELIPEVVEAAKKYFASETNGLFTDPRSRVVVEDGRNYLLGTSEKYDVIVDDLTTPWAAGEGGLYSLEHFTLAREHLNDKGIFVVWLGPYQLSEREFGIITRTFMEVFPQVTLWRENFRVENPVLGLVGQMSVESLDPEGLMRNVSALYREENKDMMVDMLASIREQRILVVRPEQKEYLYSILPKLMTTVLFTFYAGNLTHNKDVFARYPLNTDDKPLIEFSSPKNFNKSASGEGGTFVSVRLVSFLEKLLTNLPPERDPYLAHLTPEELDYVRAGLSYYKYVIYTSGNNDVAEAQVNEGYTLLSDYLLKTKIPPPSQPPNQ